MEVDLKGLIDALKNFQGSYVNDLDMDGEADLICILNLAEDILALYQQYKKQIVEAL